MNDDYRQQIYSRLNQRETDELLEIWQTNDRVEWTDTAFDVIRQILLERQVSLPEQNEPVYQHVKSQKAKEEAILDEQFLDEARQPVLYQPSQVLQLEKWLNQVAKIYVILLGIIALTQLPPIQQIISSYKQTSDPSWVAASWLISAVATVSISAIQGIVFYFPLKALASILKILMAMEFNSRSAR